MPADRLTPRQPHPRRRGEALNRPRSRREQEALSEWSWRCDDDDDPPLPATLPAPAPAPPAEEIPPVEPEPWEGPVSPHPGRAPGPLQRKRRARRLADSDPRVKL